MELVIQVFDYAKVMIVQLWRVSFSQWSIFGTWLVFMAIIRRVAKTFNKLKS